MNAKAMHTREARPHPVRVKTLAKLLLGGLALLGPLKPGPVSAQDLTGLIGGTISIFAGSTDPNASQTYDGVPANSSQIVQPFYMVLDSDNNLYFSYAGGVSVVYGGNKVPPILKGRVPSPQKGYQYMVAGSLAGPGSAPPCSPPDACGDGGPALVDTGTANPLTLPFGLAVDSAGNLYIADEVEQTIRKVSAADGTISTIAGDPMHLQNGYSGDGGPATSALLSYPNAVRLDGAGNIYIADGGNYLIRRLDTTGKISTIAGNVAAAAAANGSGSFPPSCSSSMDNCGEGGAPLNATLGFVFGLSFDPNGNLFLAESDIHVVREIDLSSASPKIHTVAGTLRTPCEPLTIAGCGDNGAAISGLLNGPVDVVADGSDNVVISDTLDNAVRLVSASDGNIQTIAGQLSAAGGYGGDDGPAAAAQLNAPNGLALDSAGDLYIADQINNLIRQVIPHKGLPPYIITFPAISSATYGANPISLGATVDQTGQPVASYKVVSGPGTISGSNLVITGAGNITVEADQPGDSNYSAATPVTQKIAVAPAVLTVTADSLSRPPNVDNPPLTYTITGFVNGDTVAVVTGTAILSTTATKSSPYGSYPIAVAQGTLSATSYTFTLLNGVLNVTQGLAQAITFDPISDVTYGTNAITLHATASSNLPVTFSVSGPAQIQSNTLVVTGAGTVAVTASQPGNDTYGIATPVTQSFMVRPATLTITPVNVSRLYGGPNPTFSYTVAGLVGGDTSAILSGAPLFSTLATPLSDAGKYPITMTQGNLFSVNYTFIFGSGALTVTPAPQTITFGLVKNTAYSQSETIVASSNSGLQVQYTATGPVKLHPAADGSSVTVSPTDLGAVTITATQAGNQNYSPAPAATAMFNIVKAEATVLVQSVNRSFGAPNPGFQFQIKLFPGDQAPDPVSPPYFVGAPDITTSATESSPPGSYTIVAAQGTLTAEHYYFVFTDGTLTVTSSSSFIITTTPTSLTIPRGSTRQLTVTLTPVNNYAGSVTLGCGGLPAGVTCSFDPTSLTIPPPDPGSSSAHPVQGTLTITANGSTASVGGLNLPGRGRSFAAGLLLVPAGFGGLVLVVGRRRFLKNVSAQTSLAVATLFCLFGALTACGGGGNKANLPSAGTTMIQVTGTGTAIAGGSDLNQSVDLSLTIQ